MANNVHSVMHSLPWGALRGGRDSKNDKECDGRDGSAAGVTECAAAEWWSVIVVSCGHRERSSFCIAHLWVVAGGHYKQGGIFHNYICRIKGYMCTEESQQNIRKNPVCRAHRLQPRQGLRRPPQGARSSLRDVRCRFGLP